MKLPHATTWPKVGEAMQAVHDNFGVDTHRPVAVIVFYGHPAGGLQAGWYSNEQFYPLDGATSTRILRMLTTDEPD